MAEEQTKKFKIYKDAQEYEQDPSALPVAFVGGQIVFRDVPRVRRISYNAIIRDYIEHDHESTRNPAAYFDEAEARLAGSSGLLDVSPEGLFGSRQISEPIYRRIRGMFASVPTTSDKLYILRFVIPEGTERIGNYAFGSYGSTMLYVYYCSITIPEGVRSIGECAFGNFYTLQSVTIPGSVRSIGARAFEACPKLREIWCLGENPPEAGPGVFANVPGDFKIYVPDASVGKYKEATNWKEYVDKIRPLSEAPNE